MVVETPTGTIGENAVAMRNIVLSAVWTGLILLIPLVPMQFSEGVNWDLFEFAVMGALLFGAGLAYELAARQAGAIAHRVAVGVALAAAFLLVWVNGAVGIIGNEGSPANLMYFGVIVVGVVGAFIARLKSHGMARALFATAVAQVLVPVIALIVWPPQIVSWGAAGVSGVFVLNAFFVMLFVGSAFLFRRGGVSNQT
jgi:hypothetical protein